MPEAGTPGRSEDSSPKGFSGEVLLLLVAARPRSSERGLDLAGLIRFGLKHHRKTAVTTLPELLRSPKASAQDGHPNRQPGLNDHGAGDDGRS